MQSTPPKLTLQQMVDSLNEPRQHVCQQILHDYRDVISTIPGAISKHQTWKGGYIAHVEEAMNIGRLMYDMLSACRPLVFRQEEALFCIFLHDFDKVLRYKPNADETFQALPYKGNYANKIKKILLTRYHYSLSDSEYNAIKYAHGEGNDYHPTERVMLPLATLVHCSDTISARIWFDEGHKHTAW